MTLGFFQRKSDKFSGTKKHTSQAHTITGTINTIVGINSIFYFYFFFITKNITNPAITINNTITTPTNVVVDTPT